MRPTSRATLTVLLAIVGAIGLLGACSDDDAAAPSTTERPATATTATAPTDPSAPSAAASARAEALQAIPDGSTDCGTVAADSGWPTTTIAAPSAGDCLVSALSAHEPAVMIFTGRTGDGGALVTRYAVGETGSVAVTIDEITSTGEDTQTTSTCAPPAGSWSLGVEGQLVDVGTDTPYC
ncbi:hypothetical protein BH10ACT1_BH10ACT1_21150 [soil metagenome]